MTKMRDTFYNHLNSIEVAGDKLGENAIKLAGHNIDLILIPKTGLWSDIQPINYIVSHINIELWEDYFTAWEEQVKNMEVTIEFTMTKKIQEGFLGKKTTGFEWIGIKEGKQKPNRISEKLNQDANLKKYLLLRFQDEPKMPNIIITPIDIERGLSAKLNQNRVFIIEQNFMTRNIQSIIKYSSRNDIDAIDTIARHLKEISIQS